MALSYRARRGLSLAILLIGLPVYIVVAISVISLMDRPPFWAELLVYVFLGFLWVIPFRHVFRGIGQADPDTQKAEDNAPSA